MRYVTLFGIVICGLFTQGCKTVEVQYYPSLLINASNAIVLKGNSDSISEIKAAVKRLLGGRSVILSNVAFIKKSDLFIERKKHFGPDGRLIQTRVDEEPIIIKLLKHEQSCFLQNQQTKKVIRLLNVNCVEID